MRPVVSLPTRATTVNARRFGGLMPGQAGEGDLAKGKEAGRAHDTDIYSTNTGCLHTELLYKVAIYCLQIIPEGCHSGIQFYRYQSCHTASIPTP
jgi:hypothetical protein